MRLRLVVLAVLLVVPGLLFAGTTCATPTVTPADSRIVDFDFVANSGDNFYQFDATAGHSYSIEVRQDYDDLQSVNDLVTQMFGTGDATCATPLLVNGVVLTDTSTVEPALPGNSFRVSMTPSSSGTFRIKVHNNNGATGRYISVKISETTLYSPFYTTFGFTSFYRILNTTSGTIHGTLTFFDQDGVTVLKSSNLTLAPNASSPTISTGADSLNVPAAKAGPVKFTHDGPPGAILIDGVAFISSGSGFASFPLKFTTVRQGN